MKTKNHLIRLLPATASVVLGIIFLLAAFSKIGDLEAFHKSLSTIGFLPYWVKGIAVLGLPGLELVLGTCLILRWSPRESAFLASCLLLGFLIFAMSSVLAGNSTGCGCFKI
jgi:uncharacterized membrane protein YphA (DoxX/SURF4 family)